MANMDSDIPPPSYASATEDVSLLVDSDLELSDCPDDLSEWSEAKADVQLRKFKQVEQEGQVDGDTQGYQAAWVGQEMDVVTSVGQEMDLDTPVGQAVQVQQDTGARTGTAAYGPALSNFPKSTLARPSLRENSSALRPPTPPASQGSPDELQPLSPAAPTTPNSVAAFGPAEVSFPASNGPSSSRISTTAKGARSTRKPKQANTPTPMAPVIPPGTLRRSVRDRKQPTQYADMAYGNISSESEVESDSDSEPEPMLTSQWVKLKASSEAFLEKLKSVEASKIESTTAPPSEATTAPTALATNAPAAPKRKRMLKDPKTPPKKRGRKSKADEGEVQVNEEDNLPPLADLFPPPIVSNPLSSLSASDFGISDDLWSAAKQLTAYAQPSGKAQPKGLMPDPSDEPPVWATDRFHLCETVPNCKLFGGGAYTKNGFAYAFLYAASASPRDYLDGSVIIARAPGGMKPEAGSTEMSIAEDQSENFVTRGLRHTMKARTPVVLITKNNNKLMTAGMPHEYCVLGHYKPTHIWWEKHKPISGKSDPKDGLRYRLERLNPYEEKAWFQPKGTEEIFPPGWFDPPIVASCCSCRGTFQQKYLQGWICVNKDCRAYWKLPAPSGQLQPLDITSLIYDPRFLKQKTTWPEERSLFFPLEYRPMEVTEDTRGEDFYSRAGWNGLVCPNCRGCIMRMSFLGWDCETPGCNYQVRVPLDKPMSASAITDSGPAFPLTDGYTPSQDVVYSDTIRVCKQICDDNFRMARYNLPIPGPDCYVVHKISNATINKAPGGPNDMFKQLQCTDIGLRRRRIGSEKRKEPKYTRHLFVNVGYDYNFVASGSEKSVPFAKVKAEAVRDVRTRLNWSTAQLIARALGRPFEEVREWYKRQEFNECLILSYFQDQAIGFHDDGEPGLGPNIATISLGDTGIMLFRMKKTRYSGVSKAGIYDWEYPPIPGCFKYKERLAQHDTIVRNAPTKNKQEYWKEAAKKLGLNKYFETPPVVLKIMLRHGDEAVMLGALLQKYYDHSVSHVGRIRFALTCRYIDPTQPREDGKPKGIPEPDMRLYDGSQLPLPRDRFGNPIRSGWEWEADEDFNGYQEFEGYNEEELRQMAEDDEDEGEDDAGLDGGDDEDF